jgi:hypothetical protein
VNEQSGFVPKTCWIADVKQQLGLRVRRAHNRVTEIRQNPCPSAKRVAIERALLQLLSEAQPGFGR